jgi:hypothetical protein
MKFVDGTQNRQGYASFISTAIPCKQIVSAINTFGSFDARYSSCQTKD